MTRPGKGLMRQAALVAAASAVLAGPVLAGNGTAVAAGSPKSADSPPSVSATSDVTATADAATGGVHVNSVSAGTTAVVDAATARTPYACIVQTRRGKNLVGYQPLTVFKQGHSYEYHYLLS